MDNQKPVEQLTIEEATHEVKSLSLQVEQWGREYYENDNPSVEDYVYDQAYQRLVSLEKAFPELQSPDSPTQQVGAATISDFAKVEHPNPMLSMGDVFSVAELIEFNDRLQRNGVDHPEYNLELKIDGLAVSLMYENGKFVQGSTVGMAELVRTLPRT